MAALSADYLPGVLCSTQTWTLQDRAQYESLLDRLMRALCGDCWLRFADREVEWSGLGEYRLQVRLHRPEGRPLYSLKWEGVA